MKPITIKEEQFVQALFNKHSATSAYKLAFNVTNMKADTIYRRAFELKNKPSIKARILQLQNSVAKESIMDKVAILKLWHDIATADPNEITSVQRRCCRHCYGKGGKFQWRDADEFASAIATVIAANATVSQKKKQAMPSDAGGYGYNFKEEPHPDCIECGGEGRPEIFIADTRRLSPAARRLFAGVKYTKYGPEIIMHNQADAAKNLAATMGMFKEVFELTGPNGAPLTMPSDPIEAAKFYAEMMKSGIKR